MRDTSEPPFIRSSDAKMHHAALMKHIPPEKILQALILKGKMLGTNLAYE
jgi:hypothetical protein